MRRTARIVAAVAGLANGLGLECVAEGVETKEQALELRALGCALLQGHLSGAPAEPERITALLAAESERRGVNADRLRHAEECAGSALSGQTSAMRTRVTELLGVQHPIVQAPMGWIARAQLASAVSNAGGLGIIETSSGDLDAVRSEIVKMRDLTDKPFGVNIAQLFVRDPKIVDFVVDQGVKFVTTSAGDPTKYTAQLKDAGLTVFHVVPDAARRPRRRSTPGSTGWWSRGAKVGGSRTLVTSRRWCSCRSCARRSTCL